MVNLFVSRLDYGVTQEDLITLFKPYGFVKKVSIPLDKETGKPRGIAFIEMNADDAQAIIDALDGYSLNNRAISVKVAEDRGSRPSPQGTNNRPDRKPFENRGGNAPGDMNRSNDRREGGSSQRDFNRPSRPDTNTIREYNSNEDTKPSFNTTEIPSKVERSPKKAKDKKGFNSTTNDGPKKGKMQAYKKSGKDNKFFSDDDDDDLDYKFEY